MKKVFILMGFISLMAAAHGQTVKKDAAGNYIAVKQAAAADTATRNTGKTFTDAKGNVYPVYISKNGKLFVIRTSSKTGNTYKQYLKIEN